MWHKVMRSITADALHEHNISQLLAAQMYSITNSTQMAGDSDKRYVQTGVPLLVQVLDALPKSKPMHSLLPTPPS